MSKSIKLLKKIKHFGWPIARNAFVGGVAGALSGRIVSDALGADAGQDKGAKIGVLAGATLGIPFGRLARGGQKVGATLALGMKSKNPNSRAAAAILGADRAINKGRVVFRKIRGKIRPILRKEF